MTIPHSQIYTCHMAQAAPCPPITTRAPWGKHWVLGALCMQFPGGTSCLGGSLALSL